MLNFFEVISYIQKNEALKLFALNVRQTEKEKRITIFDSISKGG